MSMKTIAAALAGAGLAGLGLTQASQAQPHPPMRPAPSMRIPCPDPAIIKMTPMNTPDWSTNTAPVQLHIDPLNAPRVESNTLICYYALGNQPGAFVLFRPQGPRACTVEPDMKGFICTRP
jgi:hypothetical protein